MHLHTRIFSNRFRKSGQSIFSIYDLGKIIERNSRTSNGQTNDHKTRTMLIENFINISNCIYCINVYGMVQTPYFNLILNPSSFSFVCNCSNATYSNGKILTIELEYEISLNGNLHDFIDVILCIRKKLFLQQRFLN